MIDELSSAIAVIGAGVGCFVGLQLRLVIAHPAVPRVLAMMLGGVTFFAVLPALLISIFGG